jgi:hypothetical protein
MDARYAIPAVRESPRGRVFRFRTRHLLYITFAVCAALGIPGLMYAAIWIVGPWLLLGPLMLVQFLFILLIPPLRHRLLERLIPEDLTQRRRDAENYIN